MRDFESLMSDLAAAERAGVFAKTPQPFISSSVTKSETAKFFWISPKWAIAAALVMAAGVWTTMFTTKLSDLHNRARTAQIIRAIDLQSALASCVGGPSGTLNQACGQVDFDGDGDVDLRDVSSNQLGLTGTTH